MNDPIRIVLVGTTHPGNIGASARAMKNMGLEALRLVDPRYFPHAEATARASGADDILERAGCFVNLSEAVADCVMVVGTSARQRSLPWPALEPRECARRLLESSRSGPCALVFGREKSGLSNDELECCQAVVSIPSNPAYNSLNLAMAVQVMSYEIRLAQLDQTRQTSMPWNGREAPPATADELERFFKHLETVLVKTAFLNPDNPRYLMRRLRRLFYRADLDQNEINILRGILAAVEPRGQA